MFDRTKKIIVKKRLLLAGMFTLLAVGMFSYILPVYAQAVPRITTVTQTSVSANSARIDATFSEGVESRLVFGPTSAYGQAEPPDPAFFGTATSQLFALTGLTPGTTYHYRVEIRKDVDARVIGSADRTFTTKSGSASSSGVVITNITQGCIDTECRIAFSTSVAANVQMRWDLAEKGNFNDYSKGVGEAPGVFLATNRGLKATGLTAGTRYHYRLKATAESGEFTTGDLTFLTGRDENDFTFTTGGCSDGTEIGQCSSATQGSYCAAGGILERRCGNECGFNCPSGETCNATQLCVKDPELTTSPFQCNDSECYEANGAFKARAPAGCYASWPKCSANSILKVRKDRGCNLWLSCGTSVQLEPKKGDRAENLCLTLAACNSLSAQGQCNKYLPLGQCDNNPLRFCSTDTDCEAGGTCNNPSQDEPTRSLQNVTFSTPEKVSQIANLSGNVTAGLDWGQLGGSTVIQGYLPWQLMRQIGGNAQIDNGDFESSATDPKPWTLVPLDLQKEYKGEISVAFEDPDASPNRVLRVSPKALISNTTGAGTCTNSTNRICTTDEECIGISGTNGTCTLPPGRCTKSGTSATCDRKTASTCDISSPCQYTELAINFTGVTSAQFLTSPSEYYYAEVRIRSEKATPLLRVQLGHNDYTSFTVPDGPDAGDTPDPAYVDVRATSAWQRVGLGPIRGLSGQTKLGIVCADAASCGEFEIDDAQVKPILQVDTDPSYITPSCRLYPKEDSPSCEYTDAGVKYRGWRGYCLENDSVTGTCLSWWPVDILKGEAGIFGTDKPAGYKDQNPLYVCAESSGNYRTKNDATLDDAYFWGMRTQVIAAGSGCPVGSGGDCIDVNACPQHGICAGGNDAFSAAVTPTAADTEFTEGEIYGIRLTDLTTKKNNFEMGTQTLTRNTLATVGTFSQKAYSAYWQGTDGNFVTVWFEFDETTKKLKLIHLEGNDINSDEGSLHWEIQFIMKEGCTKIVEVVQPGGNNTAFAGRVNSSSTDVPNVGINRSSDLTPYGAVVPPKDLAENPGQWPQLSAEAPNFTSYSPPGQARSGSPYACKGNCSAMVCNLDPRNPCTKENNDIKRCQAIDLNEDGEGDGQCIGVNRVAVSLKGPQDLDSTIDPSSVPTGTTQCSTPAPQQCTKTSSVSGKITESSFRTPVESATLQFRTQCTNTVACNGQVADCPGGTTVKYSGVKNVSCGARDIFGRYNCNGTCFVNANTSYQSVQKEIVNTYFAQQHIRRIFARSYDFWNWENGKYVNIRQLSPNKFWDPPTEICAVGDNGQPLRLAFPQDYCAIPPGIIDDVSSDTDGPQFLTGNSKSATITGGSGTIGIKFNTMADLEQQPMGEIRVNWGDTVDTFAYPFAPRADATKPHIFSHVYVVNPTNTNCKPIGNRTVCNYPVKIQVSDNWGWCNDATKVGSPTDQDLTPDVQCKTNPNEWYDTGLRVRVEP